MRDDRRYSESSRNASQEEAIHRRRVGRNNALGSKGDDDGEHTYRIPGWQTTHGVFEDHTTHIDLVTNAILSLAWSREEPRAHGVLGVSADDHFKLSVKPPLIQT